MCAVNFDKKNIRLEVTYILCRTDDPRQFIRRSPFATIQLTRLKEQKKIVKDWERKHGREASLTSTGLKKIDSIIDENQFNFSKKSTQGLQFLLHTYIPETVIICPDSIPFADR